MPVLAAASAAAAAGAGGTLFQYNRENYLYDRKMRQETEYQIMDFRIKQAELWREDVRDIIGLTSVKMDTYLIVNAVQLGFTVMAFCEGRLASGTPTWLVGCHTLSLAGAFMYLLMSVWFSMHASITAKSYETRLLTQLVRLPVPSWTQLEGARTYGSTFEKTKTNQMFRVPFVMGTQQQVLGETATSAEEGRGSGEGGEGGQAGSADLWGLEGRGEGIYELDGSIRTNPDELRHLTLIKEVMKYWQSYDGFARVAMSMGTNQLILGLSYYVIGYVLISNKAIMACWLVVLLFMVIATALIRLDMSLTGLEFRAAVVLVSAGPALTAFAAQQWRLHTVKGYELVHLLAPLPYAAEAAWLMLLLYISKVGEQEGGAMLPTGFRSVMYIDVFGWIKRARAKEHSESPISVQVRLPSEIAEEEEAGEEVLGEAVPGKGPAMAAVNYEGCFVKGPKATRPEQLPGASKPAPEHLATKEMFDPTTFVPREKDGQKANHEEDIHPYLKPGLVPWRIFCSATSLLLILWWISGVLILLQASGWSALRVSPLLRDSEEGPQPIEQGAAFLLELESKSSEFEPLLGEQIDTSWPPGALPRRLACAPDGSNVMLAAASRFGLFQAELMQRKSVGANNTSTAFRSAAFNYAPACDALEGEALQDVAVACRGKCALVLHRQGQRLTNCALTQKPTEQTAAMSLSDAWLGEGDAAAGEAQEEVSSLALLENCGKASGEQNCAYAETTSGRLVEMKSGLGGSGRPDWLPTRVLMADTHSTLRRGGDLHILGDRYLGMLGDDGTQLQVFDIQNSGKLLGRWPLPAQKRWTGMCSAGGSLYLLAEEPHAPQLFRFPLPQTLQLVSKSKPMEQAAQKPAAALKLVTVNKTLEAGNMSSSKLVVTGASEHGHGKVPNISYASTIAKPTNTTLEAAVSGGKARKDLRARKHSLSQGILAAH